MSAFCGTMHGVMTPAHTPGKIRWGFVFLCRTKSAIMQRGFLTRPSPGMKRRNEMKQVASSCFLDTTMEPRNPKNRSQDANFILCVVVVISALLDLDWGFDSELLS